MENLNDYLPLSHDWNQERLQTLKQLFPDLFTREGRLNLEELQKLVEPGSIGETERYEFRWFGKSQAKRNAFTPSNATLVYDEKRSVNPAASENLIIEGENLEVLKLLSASYREKIKCIYIDPPYNTGKDFVYSDNFTQDKKAYWEDAGISENGVKIDTNSDSDGRYHSNWLNMMYSRLLLARTLLKPDGVIFISIDDNEAHHLRKLCDEIFGEENFVTAVIWQKVFSPKNTARHFSEDHDYLLVYARNAETWTPNLLPRTEEMESRYANPDNDPRGPWTSGDLSARNYYGEGTYSITCPSGRVIEGPPSGTYWRVSKEKFKEFDADKRIWWGNSGNNMPRIKRFLSEVKQGLVPQTLWTYDEVGHTQEAKKELLSLVAFPNSDAVFDTPKPTRLIKRILQLATSTGIQQGNKEDADIAEVRKKFGQTSASEPELVLDFFAGSGTTGQAVFELNQENGKQINFIMVQIPELIQSGNADYKKISDITIARNKRVVEKILLEKNSQQPDIFKNSDSSGLGFKVFKLAKSNFPRIEFAPDPDKTDAENIAALKQYILDKENLLSIAFSHDELVTEILLKSGFNLNYKTERQPQFDKNDVFLATDGDKEALLCLDIAIDMQTIEQLKDHKERKFICLERALDTTKKWNLKHILGDELKTF